MIRSYVVLVLILIIGFKDCDGAQRSPSVRATLSSSLIVEGEKSLLTVSLNDLQTIGWPTSPVVTPLTLNQERQAHIQQNGQVQEVFQYTVSSFKSGTFRIAPFEVATSQGVFRSQPLSLKVFPADSLRVNGLRLENQTVPYLSALFLENPTPFQGESQHVEAKLYLPRGQPNFLTMKYPMMAELEKAGLAAWRFDGARDPSGIFTQEGILFNVFTYQSSVAPIQTGELSLGPGKASPVIQRRIQSRGRFQIKEESLDLKFPSIKLTARPLPKPEPEGFNGAVGNYTISALPLTKELELGDTITVDLEVKGTGNLAQIEGPILVDPKDEWKQYQISKITQGEERRETEGSVKFTQVIRPNLKVENLPPYRFVYFNPLLEKYETAQSLAHPLTINGSLASLTPPDESATLSFIALSNQPLQHFSKKEGLGIWKWQLIPLIAILVILAIRLIHHLRARSLNKIPKTEFNKELSALEKLTHDQATFYRAASNFVVRWRGDHQFDEIHEARDLYSFRPDQESKSILPSEKNKIIDLLKKLSPVFIFGVFFSLQTNTGFAQVDEITAHRSQILHQMATNPCPEHYYNLAVCEQTLGNSGQAVLAAYRFQLHGGDPTQFLEQTPGLRSLKHSGIKNSLTALTISTYQQILVASLWLLVILLLLRAFYTARSPKWLSATLSTLTISGFIFGSSGWALYPKDVSYKPLEELSVVTEAIPLRAQPYDGAQIIRNDMIGSLCYQESEAGDWLYLEFPGEMKGWLPRKSIRSILE